jgi:hypothetical protein
VTQAEILRVQELIKTAEGCRDSLDAMVELLELYSGEVNTIFRNVTAAAGEERQTAIKELWRQVVDVVNNIVQGKGTVTDFKKSLGVWSTAQLSLIETARPVPKPKRKRTVGLTPKQLRYIEEYCKCWNGSEAARRSGYSARSAGEISYENMQNPEIKARIDKVLTEQREEMRGGLEHET